MSAPEPRLEMVEMRRDGSLFSRDAENIMLRQWTKGSERMASQVRDSPQSEWRNSEVALRARIPRLLFSTHPYIDVSIFRHWSPSVPRRSAQERVLVRLYSNGATVVHESILHSRRSVTVSVDDHISVVIVVPLMPFTFKLPSSATVTDHWDGQARQVQVFFALSTESVTFGCQPSIFRSLVLHQYPKRTSKPKPKPAKKSGQASGESAGNDEEEGDGNSDSDGPEPDLPGEDGQDCEPAQSATESRGFKAAASSSAASSASWATSSHCASSSELGGPPQTLPPWSSTASSRRVLETVPLAGHAVRPEEMETAAAYRDYAPAEFPLASSSSSSSSSATRRVRMISPAAGGRATPESQDSAAPRRGSSSSHPQRGRTSADHRPASVAGGMFVDREAVLQEAAPPAQKRARSAAPAVNVAESRLEKSTPAPRFRDTQAGAAAVGSNGDMSGSGRHRGAAPRVSFEPPFIVEASVSNRHRNPATSANYTPLAHTPFLTLRHTSSSPAPRDQQSAGAPAVGATSAPAPFQSTTEEMVRPAPQGVLHHALPSHGAVMWHSASGEEDHNSFVYGFTSPPLVALSHPRPPLPHAQPPLAEHESGRVGGGGDGALAAAAAAAAVSAEASLSARNLQVRPDAFSAQPHLWHLQQQQQQQQAQHQAHGGLDSSHFPTQVWGNSFAGMEQFSGPAFTDIHRHSPVFPAGGSSEMQSEYLQQQIFAQQRQLQQLRQLREAQRLQQQQVQQQQAQQQEQQQQQKEQFRHQQQQQQQIWHQQHQHHHHPGSHMQPIERQQQQQQKPPFRPHLFAPGPDAHIQQNIPHLQQQELSRPQPHYPQALFAASALDAGQETEGSLSSAPFFFSSESEFARNPCASGSSGQHASSTGLTGTMSTPRFAHAPHTQTTSLLPLMGPATSSCSSPHLDEQQLQLQSQAQGSGYITAAEAHALLQAGSVQSQFFNGGTEGGHDGAGTQLVLPLLESPSSLSPFSHTAAALLKPLSPQRNLFRASLFQDGPQFHEET